MDKGDIKDLIRVFEESKIAKIFLKTDNFTIKLEKVLSVPIKEGQHIDRLLSASQEFQKNVLSKEDDSSLSVGVNDIKTQEEEQQDGNLIHIMSPIVGTFYRAPSPGAKPFIEIGDIVKKGSTLGIVEAMKMMNNIDAEFDCKVIKILATNEGYVEYDTPLFLVEKLDE